MSRYEAAQEDTGTYFYDGSGGWGKNWDSADNQPWENLSGGRRTVTATDDESDDNKDDAEGNPKSFKRVFVRFAERTSMQGVPYINASKVITAKLTWAFFLVGAMVVMSLHLYLLIDTYMGFPTYSVINLGYSKLNFPAVTFCNVNPVRKSQLSLATPEFRAFVASLEPSNIVSLLEMRPPPPGLPNQQQTTNTGNTTTGRRRKKRFLDGVSLNLTNPRQAEVLTAENQLAESNNLYAANKSTDREIEEEFTYLYNAHNRSVRMEMGHQIEDMLLSCSFSGRVCSASQFRRTTSSTYGNCYTILRPDFVSSRGGPNDGLELLLFMENDEYLHGVAKGLGLVLTIHAPNSWAFPDQEASFIASASETRVGLRRVRIERRGQPYGTCVDPDLYSSINITYTRTVCQEWCYQQKNIEDCGCFDESNEELVRRFSDTLQRPCRTSAQSLCLKRVEGRFVSENYTCNCDNPCSEDTFETSMSQRQWPTKQYAAVMLEQVCKLVDASRCQRYTNMDMRDFTDHFVKLTVFYRDLNYENITEEIGYETEQFVSDLGGTVGLWVGLSMLSMVEIIQLILEFFHYTCYVRPRQQREKQRRKKARAKQREGQASKSASNDSKPNSNGIQFGANRNSAYQPYFRPGHNYY